MPCFCCAGPGIHIFVRVSYTGEMQLVDCAGVCGFVVHPCLAADVVVFTGVSDYIVSSLRSINSEVFALQRSSETAIECFAGGRMRTGRGVNRVLCNSVGAADLLIYCRVDTGCISRTSTFVVMDSLIAGCSIPYGIVP